MTTRFEYECGVSGKTAIGGIDDDSDGLGDCPIGWTRIQITRRQVNVRWAVLQKLKETLITNTLAQMPEALREQQRALISLQVDGQFYALEKDTPVFLPDVDDVVYVSESADVLEVLNEVRGNLGLPPVGPPTASDPDDEDIEEEDDEDDEEEEKEPAKAAAT